MIPRWLLIVGLFVLMVLPVSAGVAVAQEPDLQALLTEGVAVHKADLEAWRSPSFAARFAARGSTVKVRWTGASNSC